MGKNAKKKKNPLVNSSENNNFANQYSFSSMKIDIFSRQ